MTYGFAGGVKDPSGHRGFVTVGPGDVCAIDLSHGSVLWTRQGIGRPVAATITRLLLLDRRQEQFVLRLLDAETGADVGLIEGFGMPDWAQPGVGPDAVTIEAKELSGSDAVRISWRARRPYHGGASPSAEIQAQTSDERVGTVVVDMERALVLPDTSLPDTHASRDAEALTGKRDLGPHAAPAPDVLALERIDNRLFTLKARRGLSGEAHITLEARNAHDGSQIWEAPLAERPATEASPTPPRPSPPRPKR